MFHGLNFGVAMGNRMVGGVHRRVDVADDRLMRQDIAPGDTLTIPWLGSLITLMVVARGQNLRDVLLTINDRPGRDLAACGPLQWSAQGHFEPGAIELTQMSIRNGGDSVVNVEVLLGFAAELQPVAAEQAAEVSPATGSEEPTVAAGRKSKRDRVAA